MGAPFKITLLSDVGGFLKGTADVEKGLEDVASSLDDLARESKANASEAGDALTREFSDAFDKVKTEARTTGRKIGDDIGDGARKAKQGIDEFGDEANETARETAASFDGSADSIVDMFQETAANAFAGFGPAGALAGLAAAAGIGILFAKFQEAQQQTEDYRASVASLAQELLDVGGNLNQADLQNYVQGLLLDGLDKGTSRLQRWTAAGIDAADAASALAGDHEAQQRVLDVLNTGYEDLSRRYQEGDDAASRLMGTNREVTEEFRQQTGAVDESAAAAKAAAQATDSLGNAQRNAAEASESFSKSLTDHLSVADEGLDQFVKNGKLSLSEWSAELKSRAAEAKLVQDFSVNIAPKLSPEALNNFANLPTETQAQIAKAFKDGSKSDQKTIIANLEAEAKVKNVTIDTSGVQAEANKNKVEIPTTVISAGAIKDAQTAANAAQGVANKSENAIEYKTKLNSSGLQGDVNRAAAGITAPTVWVTVKVRKEVP